MNRKRLLIVALVLVLAFALVMGLVACKTNGSNNSTQPSDGESGEQGGGIQQPSDPSNPSGNTPSGGEEANSPTAQYKISFYTGEGATQVEAMQGLTAGQAISAPDDPKLAHNTFDGWYTDYGTFANRYTFSVMPAANLCLYAKWVSAVEEGALEAQEEELARSSQEAHLYIHYLRFNNDPADYEQMTLWVWPYQYTGRVFTWERDAAGKIIVDDIVGATCDVDLTGIYTDAGKEKDQEMQFLTSNVAGANYQSGAIFNEANYMNPQIGFLIVYEDSKDSGTHWRSDGNADQLFSIKEALWDNGSIHIFCVQDNISDYVTHLSDQKEITNPYANDDGSHVSIGNVDSSAIINVEYGTNLFDTVTGVGYQIMVSSFADSDGDGMGDIRGIIQNLDYLEALNVDVLWLTPIQLSDSYHGYDIIDYKAVDPKFGSLEDYKELLTLCHQKGMKVIMDLVLNHTSTNNVWFQKSAKMIVEDGIDYRNYYQWRNHEVETNLSSDWYPYSEYAYSYYGKFSPSMPELNYNYQGTRDAIVDVAKYWLGILGDGTGVDGFRIDAVKHIYMADEVTPEAGDIIIYDYDDATQSDYSSNLTKNLNFFSEFVNRIKAEFPNTYLVGENFDGHAYNVAPYYVAYDGMLDFYMYYNFGDLASTPSKAASLAGATANAENSLPKGTNTHLLRSSEWDYEAVMRVEASYSQDGIAGSGSGNSTIVDSLFTSNHDIMRLVNNMAGGQINSANAANAVKYAKATIATMMTLPGISWIYYGDELGMSSNYMAGENANSPHVDRQYRQPFKWTKADYDEEGGSHFITHFSISGDRTFYVEWDAYNTALDGVAEQDADEGSFLNYARYWTALKSNDDVLRYGDYNYKSLGWGGGEEPLFSFTRSYNGTTYWVVTNFSQYNYDLSGVMSGYEVIAISDGSTMNALASGATIVVKTQG